MSKVSKVGKELYVGSLSYDVTEYDLEKLFSVSGTVTSVHLITDLNTGQFMGCGYVRMSTEAEAKDAIASLDGAMLIDRRITVSIANPQKMKAKGGGYRGKPKTDATPDRASSSKPASSKPAAAKPGFSKQDTSKIGFSKQETKTSFSKPGAAKDVFSKPGTSKAGFSKPGASKTGFSKPGASKTGFSKPGASKTGASRSGKR
jgi:RNA recognition motif-containing protein